MEYPRPKFRQEGVETEERQIIFTAKTAVVPKLDYPIPVRENFRRAMAHDNPLWVPNSLTEMVSLMSGALFGVQQPALAGTERFEHTDWFGVQHVFIPEAGGSMLKPGTKLLEDVTRWESVVRFPDLKSYDCRGIAEDYMKNKYDPGKVLIVNIGQGLTENLVAVMGGYTDAMLAMAVEPEAVKAYFDRYADFMIELTDILCALYPADMITYHDDWGTERDTFFSEKMMEELVYAPTKRIVQNVKDKGIVFQHHCCGRIERFVPYMIELGVDNIQLQRRANDVPRLKQLYGDRIGFNLQLEGLSTMGPLPTVDEIVEACRRTVDLYAAGGGLYTSVFGTFATVPELAWAAATEIYCYSREFYDREQGR